MRSWQKQALRLFIFGIFTINFLSLCIAVNTPLEPDSKGFTVDLMKGLGVRLTNGTSDLNVVPRLMKSSLLQSTANDLKDPEETKIMPKIQGFSLPSWGGLEFEFRKNITIPQSNVPSNLDDFPVLIDFYRDSDLFGVQQANGNDIIFTDASGNKLAHEIEKFDPTEPHLIAWVKTDLSSSADNIISMYFGNSTIGSQENPTGVWNNNYTGIYHLMEDPTGIIYDSTENYNDGTSSGGMTASNQVEGLMDGSVEFDGTNDLINIGDVNSDSWSGITVETWYFHDASGDDRVICKSPSGVTADHIFSLALVTGDRLRIRLSTDGNGGTSAVSRDSASTISIGTWHHIAFTWDSVSERIYLYIDGSQDSNNYFKDGDSIQDSTLPVIIGNVNTGADNRYFDGKIDEARISNVSRSSNWISTQFFNQYDPNSFYTLGPLEGPSPYDFFRYKKTITINHTKVSGTNDLNNFIILADIIDPDFQDNNKIDADGSNLVFINRGTNNYLYYEIESFDQNYDASNGRLVAWIKVDSLSATNDTIIDMYYGNKIHSSYMNSEEVWSDYVGVWHLGEVVSDEGTAVNIHEDGTINSNNGNQHGNDDFINGTIHLAQNFDGTNDYIEMGDPTSLELNGDSYYTFSGWFYRDTTSSTDVILDKFHPRNPEYTGYSLWIDGSDGLLYFRVADDDDDGFTLKSTSNFNTLPIGWYYYTITFDTSPVGVSTPANMQIYINGVSESAVASLWGIGTPSWTGNDDFNPFNNLADFTIGSYANQSNYFDGKLDEIRITERLLSNEWIMTEYVNQHDPQSFYYVSYELENSNWWHNDSFTRRKDIQIDSQIFGNPDEELTLRPKDTGGDDHYDVTGSVSEYLAIGEADSDGDTSFIYTSVNNSNQYFSYRIKTPLNSFDGTISKITLYSRVRITGTVISANIRNYITWEALRYYGGYPSVTTSYATYSDEWTLNPVTGEPWTWNDLVDIEFGLRGSIIYTSSQQIRITQMYALISYTSNKSVWDFPILVELSDPDLKTDAQTNGNDILFYDEVGHRLEHEIIGYTSNSSHANLAAFIKVPRLQLTKNSYISMYYGNQTVSSQEHSQETWDNNFLAVYHMEESPSNDIIDSKGNYNLTPEASMNSADLVSGKITQAIDFDGFNDQLYTTQAINIDSFAISSWIRFDTGSGWRTILNIDRSTTGDFRDFGILNNVPFFDDGSTQSFGNSLSAFTWYHLVFTFDSPTSALRCYVNGAQVGSTVFRDIQSVTDDFQVGAWNITDNFDGLIDELRISDNFRSNAWIDLEYANQLNPTTYITIGGEYDRASPNVNDFDVDDPGDGNPTFWANVTDQDSSVSSVSIEINGTSSPMSLNGSGFWIYQPSSVTFNDYYTYLIDNATDTAENYLDATSTTESITFDYDTVAPQVTEWEFYDAIGSYGTFKANVSDNWGIIDTVIVNVTYHENVPDTSSLWSIMRNTSSGFMNDTLNMIEGTINFVVTVNDTNGNSYTSTEHVSYVTNTPPVASNPNLSRDELLVLTDVFSNSTLFILYDYSDAEGDDETGSEIRWYKWNGTDWVLQAAYNDQTNISSTALIRGETWYATVKPRDGKDFGNLISSDNITIQNSAPTATNLAILPLNPTTNTILTVNYDWSDVDAGDTEQNSQIRWHRDNGNGSGFLLLSNYNNLLEIPIDETAKDNQFYFTINPNDGYENGSLQTSSIITIRNSPPTLIVKINTYDYPAQVNNDTNLDATYIYSDLDNEDNPSVDQFNINFLNVTWWWYNQTSGKFELLDAFNGSLLISNTNTVVGNLWRCDMRISDGTNSSGWVSSATISIGVTPNNAPVAWYVNLTTSNPEVGGYLFVNYTYIDEDGDNEALTTFKWYKNSIYQPQFDGIQNLSIAIFIKGDNWAAQVKPQDSKNDYGEWNSSETIIIQNTAPVTTIAEIYPSTDVFTSNTLLANYQGFDADDDLLSIISIVWLNGSVEVPSLYNQTEVSSIFTKKGEIWSYKIRIYDGTAWSTNKSSGSVTIQNTPPSIDNVILTDGLNTLDDINVSYTFVDIDDDSIDLDQTQINWTIEYDGGGSNDVNGIWNLSSTYFAAGDYVTVKITPHDGDDYGQPWEKFRVRIIVGNAKPQINGTPNILGPDDSTIFYASGQLRINYSAWDPDFGESADLYNLDFDVDGLVIGAEYHWYRNGDLVSELTNSIVPVSYLSRGDVWNVSIRPRDRYGDFGNWTDSSTITIINSPPDVSGFIEVNPTTSSEMDLELEFVYNDYDDDPINVSQTMILWYLNGTLISGTENGTIIAVSPAGNDIYVRIFLSRIHYARGDNLSVFIRAFDGYDWDLENSTSDNTTIANSLPYFDEVIITGGDNTSISMGLNLTFIDYDQDLIDSAQTKINWTIELSGGGVIQVDGVLALDSSYFAAGDYITVEITPHDSIELGQTWEKFRVRKRVGNAEPSIVGSPNILGKDDSSFYYSSEFLVINYTAADPDIGLYIYELEFDENDFVIGAEYRWYRNDELMINLTGHYVNNSYLVRGDVWKISVRPRDRNLLYGDWINSSTIIIINSPPEIISIVEITPSITTNLDLELDFMYYDFDNDQINLSQLLILWYRNGTLLGGTENNTVISQTPAGNYTQVRILLPSIYYSRGDNISVIIRSYDSYDWAFENSSSAIITIVNFVPIVQTLSIKPNGSDLPSTYTTDFLNVSWFAYDADGDQDISNESLAIIKWYKFEGVQFIEQTSFENQTYVQANTTTKGDIWYVFIQVFDSYEFSIGNASIPIIISNSPPVIESFTIGGNIENQTADITIVINQNQDVNSSDPDNDAIIGLRVYWFKNDTSQDQFENQTEIQSSALFKGDRWYTIISVQDIDLSWSENFTSQLILIINKAPEIDDITLVSDLSTEFLVEDEDIILDITVFDIDQGDTDLSTVEWYINDVYFPQYDNERVISSIFTHPGDIWTSTINPYDGTDYGTSENISFSIESRPNIENFTVEIFSDIEGEYRFSLKVNDSRNKSISDARFEIFLNGSLSSTIDTTVTTPNGTDHWVLDYSLTDYEFLNSEAVVRITVRSQTTYYAQLYYIPRKESFNILLADGAAPRVISAGYVYDDVINPTTITFYAEIQEFGIGIETVTVYYLFTQTNSTGGNGATISQELHEIQMEYQNETNNVFGYSISLDFPQEQADIDIYYRIETQDLDGNINSNAFDNTDLPDQRFVFQPPGLPEWVLLIAVFIILVTFVGSIVYVKFIRKPEVRGLDKDLVMEGVTKITEGEIMNRLDSHTIGIVVSFFHQAHGPIPIICVPELLRDNWSKLMELSDRAFSGTQFSDDFSIEIVSNYDFILDRGLHVSVMSLGYSLDRPEARGGQENITENILIHKEIFPLLNQFQEEIQPFVHKTHDLMNREPDEKQKITQSVLKLRKHLTAIVLSYEKIYGTTELVEEED